MAKPELGKLVKGLQAKGQVQAKPLVLEPRQGEPERPLADLLGDPIPARTEYEAAIDAALSARQAKLWGKRMADPRKPWMPRNEAELAKLSDNPKLVEEFKGSAWDKKDWKALGLASPQEKIKLDKVKDRARAGRVLSKAERKLLGKELLKLSARRRAQEAHKAEEGRESEIGELVLALRRGVKPNTPRQRAVAAWKAKQGKG